MSLSLDVAARLQFWRNVASVLITSRRFVRTCNLHVCVPSAEALAGYLHFFEELLNRCLLACQFEVRMSIEPTLIDLLRQLQLSSLGTDQV